MDADQPELESLRQLVQDLWDFINDHNYVTLIQANKGDYALLDRQSALSGSRQAGATDGESQ